MRLRRARPCVNAPLCPRYDPDGTVGKAAIEIRGILSAFHRDFTERLENDEQHKLKHAAIGRVAVLEGAMQMVAEHIDECTCGALSDDLRRLIEQILDGTP